jgi:predicted nucleic acid-binding protein
MLKGLPRGTSIFIDSNIFTYHLSGHSRFGAPCREFLEAVENGVYKGYINNIVISEVLLNFTKSELYRTRRIKPHKAVKEIKANNKLLDAIDFDKPVSLIENLDLAVIPVDFKIRDIAKTLAEHKLLPHDSMHLLAMKKAGIKNIATRDKDFERMKDIKAWKP